MTIKNHIHESFSREDEVKMASERSFGCVIGIGFSLIGVIPLVHGHSVRIWALLVSLAFLVLALFVPKILAPLNWLWFHLGVILHHVIQPLVMGLLFFLVVTPMGVLMRLLGKDFLHLKCNPQNKTYWMTYDPASVGSIETQY
jgi:hypothetical protein